MKFQDKVIVITGASQGLGKELSTSLASQGAKIFMIARSGDLLEKIKEGNKEINFIKCDIIDLNQVKQVVKEIKKISSKIDILINNAGIWTDEELESENPQLRKTALETNVLGHIQMTKEIIPIMKQQSNGHVLNVISTAAVSNSDSGENSLWQTYGASKWAMRGFTKDLRKSLSGTKIKVSGFFPGGFESNLYENAGRKDPHNQPWMMKTKDVAEVIEFMLSRPADMTFESAVITKMMD